MSCVGNALTKTFHFAEDEVGTGSPHERLGLFVAGIELVEHGFLQFFDRRVTSSADAPFCDFGKQSFNQVQPAGAGRGEMNVIARVLGQPSFHFSHLVLCMLP